MNKARDKESSQGARAQRQGESEPAAFRAVPASRQRVADHVFESLARSILEGTLAPGQELPTQRELAAQFNVSPLLVRQAIHRLEDLELLRVKQGSVTIVLDPSESGDLRVIELQLSIAVPSPRLLARILEAQTLATLSLLTLAERRITAEELATLVRLTEEAERSAAESLRGFREAYWVTVAKATKNSLYPQQMRWWNGLLKKLEHSRSMQNLKDPLFPELYRQLNRTLSAGEGSVALYLEMIKPIHALTEAAQGITPRQKPAPEPAAPRKKR